MQSDSTPITAACSPSLQEREHDLLFLGMHSSTGILRVQFIQDDEQVELEVQTPYFRTQILSLLIDAAGEALNKAREEAAKS
jgi:hypothetical protein